jgi:hypothetical protein
MAGKQAAMKRRTPQTRKTTRALDPRVRLAMGPAVVALATIVATLATIAPQAGGPGVTCDELYHVQYGKDLVAAFRHQGFDFFLPRNIEANFPWRPAGPPVHPPLGNWILGWTHHLFDPAPDNPLVISVAAARFAPALGLGILAFVVGLWMAAVEGPFCGTVAAAAVPLVPRVFGHGHLAALDLLTALFFTAALLATAEAIRRGGRPWQLAAAGVVWGLAMLVRLHGLLLLAPVAVWLAWRLKRRAPVPFAAWLAAGLATFFLGWPWLWPAPLAHFRQFLGTATGRQAIHAFYLGRVWADTDVPWHYPAVMFLVAVPVGLLALGVLGLWAKRRTEAGDSGFWLAIGTLTFLLAVFAWPGVPVYDGARLFLMVFPLWAIAVGVGAKWALEHRAWRSVGKPARIAAITGVLLFQAVPLITYHPCQLSHYNLLVGGLWGAERLGFEPTYWGDAVTEPLLAAAAAEAPGEPVLFGPNLAPFQAPAVTISSPALAEGRVTLVGWDPGDPAAMAECRFGLFYRRKADLASIPEDLWNAEVITEQRVQGVWLVRLTRLPHPPR